MPPVIEVRDLVKKFNGFLAVDHISFAVEEGLVFAFLGPNGAGKTTTIKMLTTVLAPSGGKLFVGGHDPLREPLLVRRSFGIVFQDPSLDEELTAYENMALHGVLYGLKRGVRRERIETLLRLVGLWERRDDHVRKFSGGMKRRLEIARALLHEPKILFLDEPTSGLDPQTRNEIWNFIRRLCRERGVTVFFTTHYMEEAERVADEIAVIDHGRIIAEGSAAALKERTGKHSLEEAFIALTGHGIREEEGAPVDRMRMMRRVWRGSRR
jgi:ABC-2 type transport system ATP-binding protein